MRPDQQPAWVPVLAGYQSHLCPVTVQGSRSFSVAASLTEADVIPLRLDEIIECRPSLQHKENDRQHCGLEAQKGQDGPCPKCQHKATDEDRHRAEQQDDGFYAAW